MANARKFLVGIDLNTNSLLNPVIHPVGTAPSSPTPVAGQIYYNSSSGQLFLYTGAAWSPLSTGGANTTINGVSGAVNILGSTNITITPSSGSFTFSIPSSPQFSGTVNLGTSVASGSVTTALNSASLNNQPASFYAPIASPTFTGTVNLGSNIATGSVANATNAGNATTTSQTNFSALTISSSAVATTAYVTSQGYVTSSGSVAGANNSASLGGQPASFYAPIASPTFTGTVNLGSNTATGSVTYATSASNAASATLAASANNAGNSTTTSQTNFTSLTIAGSAVATQSFVSSSYAPLASPTFTGTVNLGSNTATGSVNFATNAGTANAVAGATSASTASTYMVRDAAGRAQVSEPFVAADIATKNYVDNIAQGLNAHDAAVYATSASLAANYTNGSPDASSGSGVGATLIASANGVLVVDSASPLINDRILVKNQVSTLQNGMYVVTASGTSGSTWTLTRSTDGDNSTQGEMAAGDFFYVLNGTVNKGTAWVNTSSVTSASPGRTVRIGVDAVSFGQIAGPGTYTAGNGLSLTANTFAIQPTSGFTFTSGSLAYASGTTNQAAAQVTSPASWTYGIQKQVASITGNATVSSWAISHNLNSQDVQVQVYQTSTTNGTDVQYASVEADVIRTNANTVTVAFQSAPATGLNYNIVILG